MTTEEAHPRYYDGLVDNLDESLAAGKLVGLQTELKSMRSYVRKYARKHPEEFEKILRGMRLIMQMVVAQHRIGSEQLEQSYAALEAATRDIREQLMPPGWDDEV